jgi:ABC-type transport system involved in cytochrome c biogenesis permease subunit
LAIWLSPRWFLAKKLYPESMKKHTPIRLGILILLSLLGTWICFFPFKMLGTASLFDFVKDPTPAPAESFDLDGFSRIPVLRGGRVKPIDSVARNTLLVLRNKRTALDQNEKKVPAIEWFACVLFDPEEADQLKTFLIDHTPVLGLMGKKLEKDGKHYSYDELEPHLAQIEASAREAGKLEREKQDSFQQNVIELYRGLLLYRKLKNTLAPPPVPEESSDMLGELGVAKFFFDPKKDTDRTAEYQRFRDLTSVIAEDPSLIEMGSSEFAKVVFFLDHYSRANMWSEFFPIPPEANDPLEKWLTVGHSLVGEEPLDSKEKRKMNPRDFISTLRELVSLSPDDLRKRIAVIRETEKMNPTALFASQYAEAIKLRRDIDPVIGLYEKLGISFRADDVPTFNATVAQLSELANKRAGEASSTLHFEKSYNGFEPFYRSSLAYVLIFIIACCSWLAANYSNSVGKSDCTSKMLRDAAYILTGIVLLSHTFGLFGRMYIEGRPPVTNLYSSALFIGWGAVLLCFATEKYLRLGVASAMGSVIGAGSLVIAFNLSLDSSLNPTGDTMEMMRAVLDSNFWLATHVVIITIGYSTTFLAGFLGIAYVFYYLGSTLFGKREGKMKKTLESMIFGITCFSLLFSLVGTVLGGIWADQSWGRFWGWDAKENGALLIVIWNALLLHARFSGIARTRGLAAIAIFGNIVTSWSWFGTNMLGVGLHSYGFMDKAFKYLMAFILSQLAIIGLAYIPALFKIIAKLVGRTRPPQKETGT